MDDETRRPIDLSLLGIMGGERERGGGLAVRMFSRVALFRLSF